MGDGEMEDGGWRMGDGFFASTGVKNGEIVGFKGNSFATISIQTTPATPHPPLPMLEIPRLHPDTIEQVKQRADIVDVVSEHVVLRKQGKDFVGLCPFHDDKSPSFTVSPGKQFYYCFSCGAGGNTIKFLMELGKRPFSEVVLDLARRYQVSVQTLKPEERQEFQRQVSLRDQLYEILAVTAKFFEHALYQPQGKGALDYLETQRHLNRATMQQFQLGYAPAGWETLYGYLVEQKHYPVELVEKAGLLVPRKTGGGFYDRFRDRLMIPIHDLRGRVVGFGGRTLTDEQPKYLNSPETELFDKGKLLFALDKARAAIAKQDQAVVVEGYFDVIALHNAGVTNAVASMGTALSSAQVRQLLRYTESKRIVLNFDADNAGNQAAERAVGEVETLAYRGDVQLRVLNIPTGKDPDEFLQSHPAAEYQTLLDTAPLWLDWQIERSLTGKDLKQADQFQAGVQAIVKLLGNLPNATLRTHYIHRCAERLSQGDSRLMLQLEEDLRQQVRGERWHGRSQKWQTRSDRNLLEEAEAQLLRLYIHKPSYRQMIESSLEERDLEFSLSHHRQLWRHILQLKEEGIDFSDASIDLLSLLEELDGDTASDLSRMYSLFRLDETHQVDTRRAMLVIRTAIAAMEKIMCEKRRRHLLDLLQSLDWAETPDLGQLYQKKIYAEDQRIRQLEQERQVIFEDLVKVPLIEI
ncbi:MAG: DNA primase [Leptolyngbyaceae cyanobacterium bins.302]|nr:DNA primase [Leptolyngbyaceae cyanobacterium bins.302]